MIEKFPVTVGFPSPCGVNIVGNSIHLSIAQKFCQQWFPSPCGVNIVGNLASLEAGWGGSPTIMFPSPCGVNIVGNQTKAQTRKMLREVFPSPCGVNIVGNPYDRWFASRGGLRFRPLAG